MYFLNYGLMVAWTYECSADRRGRRNIDIHNAAASSPGVAQPLFPLIPIKSGAESRKFLSGRWVRPQGMVIRHRETASPQ